MIAAVSPPKRFKPVQDEVQVECTTVHVVDPDPATGKTVKDLLEGSQLEVQMHSSGRDFFSAYRHEQAACIILEQRIHDSSGLQIQRRLAEQNLCPPMIYVTANIDVSTAVALMRGGAVHILEKPLRSMELLNAIHEALARGENQRREEAENRQVQESIALLTYKERQLVTLLAAAKSTKAISAALSICGRAVELRRRGMMEKLRLDSSLELVRFAVLARQKFNRFLDAPQVEAEEEW